MKLETGVIVLLHIVKLDMASLELVSLSVCQNSWHWACIFSFVPRLKSAFEQGWRLVFVLIFLPIVLSMTRVATWSSHVSSDGLFHTLLALFLPFSGNRQLHLWLLSHHIFCKFYLPDFLSSGFRKSQFFYAVFFLSPVSLWTLVWHPFFHVPIVSVSLWEEFFRRVQFYITCKVSQNYTLKSFKNILGKNGMNRQCPSSVVQNPDAESPFDDLSYKTNFNTRGLVAITLQYPCLY